MTKRSRSTTGLAALFAVSGVLHFAKPEPYERIVPHQLPAKKKLVYASGAAELACAAGLLHPRSRRLAGLTSAALLVAIFPANVQMALDLNRKGSPRAKTIAFARLPLQLPLIRTALKASRETP
ncbi:MAG TPA: DoxX family protein [Kribbella sp.]|uniref:DoxX family protein n=1 Tax=Kribbella sp. TaxID=1871183 RepID=UPI002D76B06E|nr:DoxX family protein [Kribbella sp.]HET6296951.1 DoxX family protein [Kribbella sp.]